jgi:hypothetical protein
MKAEGNRWCRTVTGDCRRVGESSSRRLLIRVVVRMGLFLLVFTSSYLVVSTAIDIDSTPYWLDIPLLLDPMRGVVVPQASRRHRRHRRPFPLLLLLVESFWLSLYSY